MAGLNRKSEQEGPGREHGQALFEFALVVPLLLLILLGVVEMGITYFGYVAVTNAARAGARWGIAYPYDEAGIIDHAELEVEGTAVTPVVVTVSCAAAGSTSFSSGYCATAHPGDTIRVEVDYDLGPLTQGYLPFVGWLPFSSDMHLYNVAEMAIVNGVP